MEREEFNFSCFSTFVANGKVERIDKLEDYLKREAKENVSHKEKLNIGDEVKLKGVEYIVVVKYIDYEIPGLGRVDYAGKRIDKNDENLRIFNQKDIEKVLGKKKYKDDDELER